MSDEVRPPCPRRYDILDENCSSRQAIDLIANKWTILVMYALAGETRRYNELQRMISGVSQKMLTQTLRSLEADGLVHREVYPVIPPKVEYWLTPLGETLLEPIAAIKQWGETYMRDVEMIRAAGEVTRGEVPG